MKMSTPTQQPKAGSRKELELPKGDVVGQVQFIQPILGIAA